MDRTFVNELALNDDRLRMLAISHPDIQKSDGFIFVLNGHCLLHDGGRRDTACLDRLLALRELISPSEPLHLDWVISHFHVDHIDSPIRHILRDPRFVIDRIIMPSVNALPEGMINVSRDYTDEIMDIIRNYHPNADIHVVPFYSDCGGTFLFELGGAELEILPPDTDWSSPELLHKIAQDYFCTDDIFYRKIQMYVANISSLWMIIRYGGKKLIFTGDTPKRTRGITDEAFDRMCRIYADKLRRPDLLKWPHHGQAEDEADITIHDLIDPEHILLTTSIEGASVQYQKTYHSFRARFVNSADEDVLVTAALGEPLSVKGGHSGVNEGEYFLLDIPGKHRDIAAQALSVEGSAQKA